jgi:hypothetical protein
VGDLLAHFFGVIHGHLAPFFDSLARGLADVLRGISGVLKSFLGSIGGFHYHGFCTLVNLSDRAFGSFYTVFANLSKVIGRFLRSFCGATDHQFGLSFSPSKPSSLP